MANESTHVEKIRTKVKFQCKGCAHKWTSGLGQFAFVFKKIKKLAGCIALKLRVMAYWFSCIFCDKKGDMKAYESEMERIAYYAA